MISYRTFIVAFLTLCALGTSAQRRTVSQMRDAVCQVMPIERVAHLQPLDAASLKKARLSFNNITLLSGDGGYAVVSNEGEAPAVLAYGSEPINLDNISPELLYLLDLYEDMLSQPASSRREVKRRVSFTDISPLVRSAWAQSAPYYNKCPLYDGGNSRCVTGCVATAMAQVLYYHKLPTKMRGYKTYGYTNKNNHRVSHSFDFGATTFDWANMKDSYSTSNAAQRDAVATLMYACGVATGMNYSPSESAANPWVGADGINCFMDGLRAESKSFSSDDVLTELQAGRPVIYSGSNSKNGAHCFVIDGCNKNGYFHCNLGWGGSGDNYYLPTDMAGYAVNYQNIVRVWPSNEVPTYTPIAELQDKFATVSHTPATTMEPNRWYVLWNAGRSGSPISNGKSQTITNTSMMPSGEETIYTANQLVRFVPNTAGTSYYIQTGLGDYWGSFTPWGGTGVTTATRSATFKVGSIQQGYFWIQSGSTCYLDTNGPGSTVVGWNTAVPTDTVSNSSWRFYPVSLSDSKNPDRVIPEFDADKFYTLRNTGYSQGYLVALTADDAQPTLRGVTQDHAQGLYQGAQYHDEVDLAADGSHWRITTEKGEQYLQNVLTGKYLANQGDQTNYVFTAQKTPIYITQNTDGTYLFNTGTQEQSYLCAATHAANPAAFWTATDAGSIWTVEEAPAPEKIVFTPVKTDNGQLATDYAQIYALRNTGYSQGYLVAQSATDAHPTLRGVTQDHSNGLFQGAAYHDALDKQNLGSYWQILKQDDHYYLYNVGTERFLTSTGVKESYVFTEDQATINVSVAADGTFRFNAQTDSESFLCAATHLENPAAFWTSTDDGSKWTVYKVTGLDYEPRNPLITSLHTVSELSKRADRLYDLQGRVLTAPRRGVMITPGRRKMMR